ncbi:hypothetical protein M758_2G147100 [Ceratodon purpureus]|nr:hypothetical protein M758_2G147100 [Ceratodon purpureus]
MQGGRKQYGLQLQIKGPPKKPTGRPAPAVAFRFNDGDEEDDVEADIARQANKKRNVREVEQQYQKALEEDPTAFDYDGVYDEMKGNQARPIHEDRAKREPKYIGKLLEKAKVRAREQDIVYERQLAKEREKEDHLYGDKEKFVTGAYKKKLQEQAKWLEEERRREAEEQKHEVGNKSDMSDFYRNLLKSNVAFGARNVSKPGEKASGAEKDAKRPGAQSQVEDEELASTAMGADHGAGAGRSDRRSEEPRDKEDRKYDRSSSGNKDRNESGSLRSRDASDRTLEEDDQRSNAREKPADGTAERSPARTEEGVAPKDVKSSEVETVKQASVDPVAAAKERYLARKRQRGL